MLLRLAYRGITNASALLRLLPGSDRDMDTEILALRHQLAVLQRQLDGQRVRFQPADRAWLGGLLHCLPGPALRRLRLLVQPETILRWHRALVGRRHAAASRPRRSGRPRTVRSIRLLVVRLLAENPSWGHRRVHGELLTGGVKLAASTVWEILHEAGMDPAPDRVATIWGQFLRSQAPALLALDFIETVTLTGTPRRTLPTPTRTLNDSQDQQETPYQGQWLGRWIGCNRARVRPGSPTRVGRVELCAFIDRPARRMVLRVVSPSTIRARVRR